MKWVDISIILKLECLCLLCKPLFIVDIQKDLYKIEDENQINEVRPVLDVELTKKYTKYKSPFKL